RDFRPGTWLFLRGLPEENRGWIEIDTLTVDGGAVAWTVEGTVLTSEFPRPLLPGGQAVIAIEFTERIRRRMGRAGYAGRHYDMAQWYPKMAVYDARGWHPDQFRMGEFYGEFGAYDVSITLPEEYVVVATGTPVGGDPGWTRNPKPAARPAGPGGGGHPGGHPGSHAGGGPGADADAPAGPPRTVRFRAERVHDFAWCADPDYVVEETSVGETRVMTAWRSWNASWADSALARTVRTVRWLERLVGPYEWPVLTVADSPTRGGMEYPMLVMNGSADMGLIVHEVAHMWFYGMLANDERAEAWLDEGPAQYFMFRWLDERGGSRRGGGHPGSRPRPAGESVWDGVAASVIEYHRDGFAEPVATPHHAFRSSGTAMVYNKSALFFRALRYRVGDEDFHRILREYFAAWKFRHVDEEALLTVAEEVAGVPLEDFFKQWIHSVKDCDYVVDRFDVRDAGEGYEAQVRLKRRGEMISPLELVFALDDGLTRTERIDGMSRVIEKSFAFDSKPRSVAVNPANEILDVYRLDNRSPRAMSLGLDLSPQPAWPRDAYRFLVLPIGYYNDIDGGKAGARLRGSYDGKYRAFTAQGLYGFESGAVDGYARIEHPVGWLRRETALRLEGFYREGRGGASIEIDKTQRESLSDPMPRFWRLRFGYHDLFDERYVRPGTWDGGTNIWLGAGLSLRPSADIFDADLSLDFDRSFWGSARSWERFTFEARARATSRFPFPLKPGLRLWFGNSAIDPFLQNRFNLAGAGVLEKDRFFWLRSVGAFPADRYANWRIPGNSDLRGYYEGDYPFKRVASISGELDLPFPLFGAGRRRELRDRRLFLFYDAGWVLDDRPLEALPPELALELGPDWFDTVLQDFGIGVKLWRVTAELPFWVSRPGLIGGGERWDARWTVGLDLGF
ncbi:MAG: M1 family metallopeptidase, partial [Candidatus Krumholzibacteria bacterium]|nr:M1 family metallopeptidase [Candidatus Krumholzibacteria bacterium]